MSKATGAELYELLGHPPGTGGLPRDCLQNE